MSEKNNTGGITTTRSKVIRESFSNKNGTILVRNCTDADQWDGRSSFSSVQSHLTFHKGTKNAQYRGESVFNN